ncbi:hypothetical protein F4861DRAFT_365289 [Xylaria intraflava]|nr:hypothetical protein F4861DRAFT_365289 [Xylaria intraflava]
MRNPAPKINPQHVLLRRYGRDLVLLRPYPFLVKTTSVRWEHLLAPPIKDDINTGSVNHAPPSTTIPRSRVATVLYSVTECGITKDALVAAPNNSFYPPLPVLIDNLLDMPVDGQPHNEVVMILAYLYDYAPELKSRVFATQLDHLHRQFHPDRPQGQWRLWTIPFVEHERRVPDDAWMGK